MGYNGSMCDRISCIDHPAGKVPLNINFYVDICIKHQSPMLLNADQ